MSQVIRNVLPVKEMCYLHKLIQQLWCLHLATVSILGASTYLMEPHALWSQIALFGRLGAKLHRIAEAWQMCVLLLPFLDFSPSPSALARLVASPSSNPTPHRAVKLPKTSSWSNHQRPSWLSCSSSSFFSFASFGNAAQVIAKTLAELNKARQEPWQCALTLKRLTKHLPESCSFVKAEAFKQVARLRLRASAPANPVLLLLPTRPKFCVQA